MQYFNKINPLKHTIVGGLYIREYPAGQATVNTIHAHLEQCKQQNIEPDLVIIDYADLMTSHTSKEKRDKLDDIYTNLRGLATQMKLPIWTASQTNRSGLSAEVITMEQISEAFNKCFVSDFIFSISRTTEDKMGNTGRVFIAKNGRPSTGIIL